MKNKHFLGGKSMGNRIKVIAVFLLMLIMVSCSTTSTPKLKGFYQSEAVAGEIVQISIYDEESRFDEYISNREVNSGTYTLEKDGSYQFDGNEQDFNIVLKDDNSFELSLPKLDKKQNITMKNISEVLASFGTEFQDVEKYKELLK